MTKRTQIIDLQIEQKISGEAYALKEFETKVSRQGKSYYNVSLGDKSGEIRGKVWTESMPKVDAELQIGDIVTVTALVQEYAGKPQLIIDSMKKETTMAPEEFLPVTARDRETMQQTIEEEISKTQNKHLKELLELFWNNETYRDQFKNFPAAEYVHHGYVGGLLEHVYEMLELSRPYLRLYPELDRDLIFTGLFFHDIGKLEELDIVGATIVRTNSGRLVAHIGQGLLFVDHLVQQLSDFPEDLRDKLYHLILSHQGQLEYGSPIKPQMLESLVLSMVDADSASMNQATKHIQKNLESGEDFTDYHKWLGRSFYQGDYIKGEKSGSEKDTTSENSENITEQLF